MKYFYVFAFSLFTFSCNNKDKSDANYQYEVKF